MKHILKSVLALAILALINPNHASADQANHQSGLGLRPIQDTGGDSSDLLAANQRTGSGQSGSLSYERDLESDLDASLEAGLDDGLADDSVANPEAVNGWGWGANLSKSRRQAPESFRHYRPERGSDMDQGQSWDRHRQNHGHCKIYGHQTQSRRDRDGHGRSWDRRLSGRRQAPGLGYVHRTQSASEHGHGAGQRGGQAKKWEAAPKRTHRR